MRIRSAVPVFAATLLAAVLAGCAPQPEPADPTACTPVAAGSASEGVAVSGDLASSPEAEFDPGLSVDASQRSVAVAGTGDLLASGDTAEVNMLIYNATTGEQLGDTLAETGGPVEVPLDGSYLAGIEKSILCSHVGDRIVSVVPPADAFGDQGYADLGIGGDDSLVLVIDVTGKYQLPVPAAWTDGVPEVSRDASGAPTITLPEGDAPAELRETVLTPGDGDTVQPGASVTVNYQGVSWDTGEVFDESFGGDPATFSTNGVVEGFAAALVGQKVGSTVLVVIPPELGYGTDPSAHELGGQTLVFLVDILETAAG